MLKKVAFLVMICILFTSCGICATATFRAERRQQFFSDVSQDSSYYEAIYWAVDRGITNGTSSTTFSPNMMCKRKHIIVFLWRSCGRPLDKSWSYPYSADSSLSADSDFGKAATWAFWRTPRLEQGSFLSGNPNQLFFEPDRNCTRGEAVIYLWRMAGCPSADTEKASQFKDVKETEKSVDSYLRELPTAVAWAVENKITNGTTPETFSPEKTCTRGQISTFLFRFSNTDKGKEVMGGSST